MPVKQFLQEPECLEFINRLLRHKAISAKTNLQKRFAEALVKNGLVYRKLKFYAIDDKDKQGLDRLKSQFNVFDINSVLIPPGEYSHATLSAIIKKDSKIALSDFERSELSSIGVFLKEDRRIAVRGAYGTCFGNVPLGDVPTTLPVDFEDVPIYGVDCVVSVENKAYFTDVNLLAGELLIWTEGLNVAKTHNFYRSVVQSGLSVDWFHIPDLDPRGVIIATSLKSRMPELELLIPNEVCEIEKYSRPMTGERGKVPWSKVSPPDHPVFQYLVENDMWLEQEVFVMLQKEQFASISL